MNLLVWPDARTGARLARYCGCGLACAAIAIGSTASCYGHTPSLATEEGTVQSIATAANRDDQATVIRSDTQLDPNQVYGRLVIAASDITIDGRGALIQGDQNLPPNQRTGVGITAEGVSRVTLKNVRVHHWETGLRIVDGEGWTIADCDFSDNFHDPEYGWGENGRRGGMVLEGVSQSSLRRNRAQRVWDGCVLLNSSNNHLSENDFSHASNTCLKLWNASRNEVLRNQLTHGIRITPGEVHARDSTGVLIESGSNANRFISNDCTYGGDGIFIRVLNGWCSTDNYFEGNDCSYANNNGFECWAPRNTFVRNKANHCSYGFWLGGSDQTRLIDNEASFNGLADGQHNSPHLPDRGHAGIVFMFGPSSHILARGNRCTGNHGAGIALIGDLDTAGHKWKAYHWILENNELHDNRWGIYAQYADWIRLVGNDYRDNHLQDLHIADGVSDLKTLNLDPTRERGVKPVPSIPRIRVHGPTSGVAGQSLRFRCDVLRDESSQRSGSMEKSPVLEWQLGDGTTVNAKQFEHSYSEPGFYRVGVNAIFEHGLELAYRDVVVVADQPELANESHLWSFEAVDGLRCTFASDETHRVAGEASIRCTVDPYHGGLVRLEYPSSHDAQWQVSSTSRLGFWLKAINPNMPGWQSNNPEVTLYGTDGRWLRLVPKTDLFSAAQYSEAREGWRYIEVPLRPHEDWTRTGETLDSIAYLTLGIDSWDAQPLTIWIDGLILLD